MIQDANIDITLISNHRLVTVQESEIRSQKSEFRIQKSEIRIQNSEEKILCSFVAYG